MDVDDGVGVRVEELDDDTGALEEELESGVEELCWTVVEVTKLLEDELTTELEGVGVGVGVGVELEAANFSKRFRRLPAPQNCVLLPAQSILQSLSLCCTAPSLRVSPHCVLLIDRM